MTTTAIHFAVPVFVDDEPVKPYRCQRCEHPIRRSGSGWLHVVDDDSKKKVSS